MFPSLLRASFGLVLLASCGQSMAPPPPATCSPSVCGGCCDANGVCQPGQSISACGTGGAACQACSGACVNATCQVQPDPLPAGAKLVFASSLGLAGNFGDRAAADQHCVNLAQAAGLSGQFVAWLSGEVCSGGTCTPYLARDAVTGTGPWYLPCRDAQGHVRQPFANRPALLTAPATAIDCDEKGRPMMSARVWSGTAIGGGGNGYSQCADYDSVNLRRATSWTSLTSTGSTGYTGTIEASWTDGSGASCSERHGFYCFQN